MNAKSSAEKDYQKILGSEIFSINQHQENGK